MDICAYRLELEGELTDRAAQALSAASLTYDHGNTIVIRRLRDQSELQGLLQRVSECGLTLVSLRPMQPQPRD
jgi:hypothetical protein